MKRILHRNAKRARVMQMSKHTMPWLRRTKTGLYTKHAPKLILTDFFNTIGGGALCMVPTVMSKVLQSNGLTKADFDTCRKYTGPTKWTHINMILNGFEVRKEYFEVFGRHPAEVDVDDLHDQYQAEQMKFIEENPRVFEVCDGFPEFYMWARANDIKLGVTSGFPDGVLERFAVHFQAHKFPMDFWVGSTYFSNLEDMITTHLNVFGVQPNETVYMGDTASNVLAGNNKGTGTVFIGGNSDGLGYPTYEAFDSRDEFDHETRLTNLYHSIMYTKPDAIVDGLEQVPQLFSDEK